MRTRIVARSVRWFGLFAAALLVALALQIYAYDARLSPGVNADAAIVLGAAAYGGKPSPVFAGRLEYGDELLRTERVRYVIVTGGGRADPTQPEAAAGVHYLVARGRDPSRVLSETRSFSTPENLCEAKKVAARYGLRTFLIVSDPLHLRRALHYARALGMDARPAATPFTRYTGVARFSFTARETYIFAKHLLWSPQYCRP